jgi:hypothetical protein
MGTGYDPAQTSRLLHKNRMVADDLGLVAPRQISLHKRRTPVFVYGYSESEWRPFLEKRLAPY